VTLPNPGPLPDLVSPTGRDLELDLVQALDDCYKVLDCSPVSPLADPEGWVAAQRLRCLLDSMMATAAAERRLRDAS
jgi:hypothetical protein